MMIKIMFFIKIVTCNVTREMKLKNKVGATVAVLGSASIQKIVFIEGVKTLVFVKGEPPTVVYVDVRGMHPVRKTLSAVVLDDQFSALGISNPLPRVRVALDGYMNYPGNGAYVHPSTTEECRL